MSSILAQPNPMDLKDISIGKVKTKVGFYEFPDEPLGDHIKTYNVSVTVPLDWPAEMVDKAIESCFIEGLEKIEGDADLSIILQVESFALGRDSVITRLSKDCDKYVEKLRINNKTSRQIK